MISNVTAKYSCIECKYSTNHKCSIERHLKSKKHIEHIKPKILDITCDHQCLGCLKKYNSQSSLWHHKQKCVPLKDAIATSKVKEEFGCIDCKYSTTNKTSMQKHLITPRHIEQMKPKTLDIEWINQCLICYKKYDSQSSLWHHKQKCSLIPVAKEVKIVHVFQYIYLIQEREFVKNNERVYKIGKTKQPNLNRFKQYPKDSILISQISCLDCDICEKQLLQIFKFKYLQKTDIGTEYFEGDHISMTLDIMSTISKQLEGVKSNMV
jgi:phenylpropionate dioxygenase-like ring-hydroxylating dioxygenase large terminal subunit